MIKSIVLKLLSIAAIILTFFAIAAPSEVRIYGIQDYAFGTISLLPNPSNQRITHYLCVFHNNGTQYELTANSANASGGRFYLRSGSNEIRYRVRWDGPVGGYKTMEPGVPRVFSGAITGSSPPNCSSVQNRDKARLQILIRRQWLDNPTPMAGSYSDTLVLTVAPV